MTARGVLQILSEERVLILAVMTLAVISAVVAGQLVPPEVSATAQVLVHEGERTSALLGLVDSAKTVDHDVLVDTHVRLAASPTIARRVIDRLTLAETPESILRTMSVSALGRSNVLAFEVEAPSQEAAAKLADTWVAEYIAWSAERSVEDLDAASKALAPRITAAEQRLVEVQARIKTLGHTKELDTELSAAAADYEQLLAGADRIALLSSVSAPPLSVVSNAIAEERSDAVSMVIDALKGLMAGAVLGIAMAFVRHRLSSATQPG
ncbi:MAG: hypothetical protein ACYC77_05905 [Coriobacteriia bacterium]